MMEEGYLLESWGPLGDFYTDSCADLGFVHMGLSENRVLLYKFTGKPPDLIIHFPYQNGIKQPYVGIKLIKSAIFRHIHIRLAFQKGCHGERLDAIPWPSGCADSGPSTACGTHIPWRKMPKEPQILE
jgi:hypothetical protein